MTVSHSRYRKRLLPPAAVLAALLALHGCGNADSPDRQTVSDRPATPSPAAPTAIGSSATQAAADPSATRSADSHVHGGAELALAVDGDTVAVELDTPLYNLLGYERAPETAEQRREVERVESRLSDPATLFAFNAQAACEAQAPATPVALFGEAGEGDGHDADHSHDDDHDDDHSADHDHDDGHDHEDDHDGHAGDTSHRDAVLSYTFACARPEALRSLEVGLLAAFPLMEELDVVYLGVDTQKSAELSGSQTTLDLRP